MGNHRDEMLFTDPHIRHKIKESAAHGESRTGDFVHMLRRTLKVRSDGGVNLCQGQSENLGTRA